MKKLLTAISTISIIGSGAGPVIACSSNSKQAGTMIITKDAKMKAIIKFANDNGIRATLDSYAVRFTTQASKADQDEFGFILHKKKNASEQEHSYLLLGYQGQIIYHFNTQSFTLDTTTSNPFKTPIYIPGIYDASLDITSAITGTYTSATNNDFTIAIGSDDLYYFNNEIARATTTQQVFKVVHWTTPNEQQLANKIPISLLKDLSDTPQAWQIPQNYMAVIHVVNNKIAWSNLQTQADKTSLHETHNRISSLVTKHSPSSLNLVISPSLAQEIIQVYNLNPDAQNSWFQTTPLTHWLQNNPNDVVDSQNGYFQAAIVPKSSCYDHYNATFVEGVGAIQHLVSTSAILAQFQQKIKTLSNANVIS